MKSDELSQPAELTGIPIRSFKWAEKGYKLRPNECLYGLEEGYKSDMGKDQIFHSWSLSQITHSLLFINHIIGAPRKLSSNERIIQSNLNNQIIDLWPHPKVDE